MTQEPPVSDYKIIDEMDVYDPPEFNTGFHKDALKPPPTPPLPEGVEIVDGQLVRRDADRVAFDDTSAKIELLKTAAKSLLDVTNYLLVNDAEEELLARETGTPRTRILNPELRAWRERLKLIAAGKIASPLPPKPPHWIDASAREAAQLLPPADTRLADYGPVGTDDITGDLLLDAFEENEAETAAIVQTLSALRLKHLSEQLNVERARLDREHQATGVANPRSASIDRLLGLLTRRGEV
jgi:hypothetical protein